MLWKHFSSYVEQLTYDNTVDELDTEILHIVSAEWMNEYYWIPSIQKIFSEYFTSIRCKEIP